MSVTRRLLTLAILATSAGLPASHSQLSGQTPKDKAKDKKGTLILSESLEINPGDPLSIRTPVTKPGNIKGVKSWTVETKRHRWAAINVAVNPEGTIAATGGYDGTIRLWDLATGKFQKALVGHGSYIYGLAFSHDGNMLASAGSWDATVRIWNVKTGMTMRILRNHKDYTNVLAWSPDDKFLVATGGGSGFATFWDLQTGKQEKTLDHGTPVSSVAWSPNGRMVACALPSGTFIWSTDTYTNIKTLKQDGNYVYCLTWSPDSKFLISGGTTNFEIWKAEDFKSVLKLAVLTTAAAWSPDNKYIAVAGSGGPVQLYDAKSYKSLKTLPVNASSMQWANEGKTLVGVTADTLSSFDLAENKVTHTINIAKTGTINWNSGKPIIAGFGGKSLTLWETATGKLQHTLDGHTAAVGVAAWSRDGKFLATGSADKTARTWDLNGKPHRTLEGHGSTVNALAWSPDGRLATGCADKAVRVFPLAADKAPLSLMGHSGPVTAMAWSRDGKTLVSGGSDRNVMIWNIESQKPFKTLSAEHDVLTVAISNDGKLLVSGGTDDVVRLWSLPSGKFLHKFDTGGSPPHVSSLAFSPDNAMIAVGKGNHTMTLLSVKEEKVIHSMATMAPVTHVAWTPDGKTVASCSIDRSLRFWETSTGKLRATLIADNKQFLAIGAEGHYRSVPDVESELIFVIQTDKTQETFDVKSLPPKFPWRNNPGLVKLTGN